MKVSLDELRIAKELAELEHKTVSDIVRDRIFSQNQPEHLILLKEIHHKICNNGGIEKN